MMFNFKAFSNFLFDFLIDLLNLTSYEYKNKLTKSGAQFVNIVCY